MINSFVRMPLCQRVQAAAVQLLVLDLVEVSILAEQLEELDLPRCRVETPDLC
jgi:hypothetical protein